MTKGKYTIMLDIRTVIHRLREGHSDRRIGREVKIDRSIVKKIRALVNSPSMAGYVVSDANR